VLLICALQVQVAYIEYATNSQRHQEEKTVLALPVEFNSPGWLTQPPAGFPTVGPVNPPVPNYVFLGLLSPSLPQKTDYISQVIPNENRHKKKRLRTTKTIS
jgi:hypothetical protein